MKKLVKSISVVALNAPSGAGAAAWENGTFTGDEKIQELAKQTTHVTPNPEDMPQKMNWDKPEHIIEALRQGAQRAYGEPVLVISDGIFPDYTQDVEASQTPS